MQVMVKVNVPARLPENLLGEPGPADIFGIVTSWGLEMQPLHPESDDAELRCYYTIEVADPQLARDLVDRLVESPAVGGAYIKPAEALP
jgi:hypothetical protein